MPNERDRNWRKHIDEIFLDELIVNNHSKDYYKQLLLKLYHKLIDQLYYARREINERLKPKLLKHENLLKEFGLFIEFTFEGYQGASDDRTINTKLKLIEKYIARLNKGMSDDINLFELYLLQKQQENNDSILVLVPHFYSVFVEEEKLKQDRFFQSDDYFLRTLFAQLLDTHVSRNVMRKVNLLV